MGRCRRRLGLGVVGSTRASCEETVSPGSLHVDIASEL